MQEALKLSTLEELLRFLFKEHEDQIYAQTIGNKMYVPINSKCKTFYTVDGELR